MSGKLETRAEQNESESAYGL